MEKKITKEEFIEVIENNEEVLYDFQLAEKLNISQPRFSQLKKEYKKDIRDIAKEMAEKSAAEMMNLLRFLARRGDTSSARISAIIKVLEIGEVYIPKSKQDIDAKHEHDINFTLIDRFVKNGNNEPSGESDTT